MANTRLTREVQIDDLTFTVKQLGGLQGFRKQAELFKMITPVLKQGSQITKNDSVMGAIGAFLKGEVALNEAKLKAMIGPDEFDKLQDLVGVSSTAEDLSLLIEDKIQNPEMVYKILQEATEDSTEEVLGDQIGNVLENSLTDIMEMVDSVLHKIDEEKVSSFMKEMIEASVIQHKDQENNIQTWGGEYQFHQFNEQTTWDVLLQVTIYLCLFNFASPIRKLVKKNKISKWNSEFLGEKEQKA